jgi:hypothetical protein
MEWLGCGSILHLGVEPRLVVVVVFNGERFGCDLKRPKGIDHDSEFFCFGFANASLVRAGVRAVRNARRVQRNVPSVNACSTHEITFDVIQDFVGIDV